MYSVPKIRLFKRIVLASGSPRRKEILTKQAGIENLEVIPSTFEEERRHEVDKSHICSYVEGLALGKAKQVAENDGGNNTLYIGADTVLYMDNIIFEKPTDDKDAFNMIKGFSGRSHQVYSGVAILAREKDGQLRSHHFNEMTEVTMPELSDETVKAYVAMGESMDKAGGYGLQSLGAQIVQSVTGDYCNVIGFPLFKFCQQLNKFLDVYDFKY